MKKYIGKKIRRQKISSVKNIRHQDKNSSLFTDGFFTDKVFIAMRKGFPLKKMISNMQRAQRKNGRFEELKQLWLKDNCKVIRDSTFPEELEIKRFNGLLVILCGTILFSFVIFFLEFLYNYKWGK